MEEYDEGVILFVESWSTSDHEQKKEIRTKYYTDKYTAKNDLWYEIKYRIWERNIIF